MNLDILKKWISAHEPQGATKLAAAAEVSPGTVYKIMNHGRSPGVEIAARLARVVGVSLDDLCRVGQTDEDEPPGAA